MSLVTPSEVRVLVQTSLNDEKLQTIIDREEFDIVERFGAHYGETNSVPVTVIETLEGDAQCSLFLRRRIASVSAIVDDGTTLTTSSYRLWGKQGRIERLPRGATWGDVVQVTYVPYDDNSTRKSVIIELVRLALNRTAMKSESIGGEYSYSAADDWETERNKVLRRLSMSDV